ncbi:MAG: prepilin-type N-terminal cleavage/methylation domain-containing protein [Bdellovibrionota bacterium]
MGRRNNNAGFSLVELMVAVAILSVIVLMNMQIVEEISNTQVALMKKIQSEENVMQGVSSIKRNLSMAVNLIHVAGPINGNALLNNRGQIATYNLAAWAPTLGPGAIDVISAFIRENKASDGVTALNALPAETPADRLIRFPISAIFFQRPTLDKYGVLYIDVQATPVAGVITPKDSAEKIPYIVDFEIMEVFSTQFEPVGYAMDADLSGRFMAMSATIRIVQRNYFGTTFNTVYRWCPPAFMGLPACATDTPYKDTEKIFTVGIRNNVLGRSKTRRGLATNVLVPPADVDTPPAPYFSRREDGIYFLKSRIPLGGLSR